MQDENLIPGAEACKLESEKWPKVDRGNGTWGTENPKLETTANENFLRGERTPRLYLPRKIWRTNLLAILGDDHGKQIRTERNKDRSSSFKRETILRRNPFSREIQNPLCETRSIGGRTGKFHTGTKNRTRQENCAHKRKISRDSSCWQWVTKPKPRSRNSRSSKIKKGRANSTHEIQKLIFSIEINKDSYNHGGHYPPSIIWLLEWK
jgi:hypothetical protein